ncbi:MAG: diaminopimelate epimerase [Candidatus Latescibacterota bacterium]|nr:MAG: diaminopimelate epimerase [Candidatus Latescibacterota bacterium]
MGITFSKMNGAGNDFVVLDNREGKVKDYSEFVRKVCRRRLGVGADGALFVEHSTRPDVDFRMRYFNADGSEAEMCGNGGRCIARFAYLKGIAGPSMSFETMAGVYRAEVKDDRVMLEMLPPKHILLQFELDLGDREIVANFADTGVPHVVAFGGDVDRVPVKELGRLIREHERFAPAGTNANFAQVLDRHTIKLRTYERGVEDETLACGTGVVAAAVLGALLGRVDPPVSVLTRSGVVLTVHFRREGKAIQDVLLEGDAVLVFEGELSNEWLGDVGA